MSGVISKIEPRLALPPAETGAEDGNISEFDQGAAAAEVGDGAAVNTDGCSSFEMVAAGAGSASLQVSGATADARISEPDLQAELGRIWNETKPGEIDFRRVNFDDDYSPEKFERLTKIAQALVDARAKELGVDKSEVTVSVCGFGSNTYEVMAWLMTGAQVRAVEGGKAGHSNLDMLDLDISEQCPEMRDRVTYINADKTEPPKSHIVMWIHPAPGMPNKVDIWKTVEENGILIVQTDSFTIASSLEPYIARREVLIERCLADGPLLPSLFWGLWDHHKADRVWIVRNRKMDIGEAETKMVRASRVNYGFALPALGALASAQAFIGGSFADIADAFTTFATLSVGAIAVSAAVMYGLKKMARRAAISELLHIDFTALLDEVYPRRTYVDEDIGMAQRSDDLSIGYLVSTDVDAIFEKVVAGKQIGAQTAEELREKIERMKDGAEFVLGLKGRIEAGEPVVPIVENILSEVGSRNFEFDFKLDHPEQARIHFDVGQAGRNFVIYIADNDILRWESREERSWRSLGPEEQQELNRHRKMAYFLNVRGRGMLLPSDVRDHRRGNIRHEGMHSQNYDRGLTLKKKRLKDRVVEALENENAAAFLKYIFAMQVFVWQNEVLAFLTDPFFRNDPLRLFHLMESPDKYGYVLDWARKEIEGRRFKRYETEALKVIFERYKDEYEYKIVIALMSVPAILKEPDGFRLLQNTRIDQWKVLARELKEQKEQK